VIGRTLGNQHLCSVTPGLGVRYSNDERNPACADLRHVRSILRVSTEEAFLDEALNDHPENGDRQQRDLSPIDSWAALKGA